jgi:hypothetical protein
MPSLGARIPSRSPWRAPRIDYLNGGVGTLRITPTSCLGILDEEVVDVEPPTPLTAFSVLFLLLRRRGILGEPLGVSSREKRLVARAERGCLWGRTELS